MMDQVEPLGIDLDRNKVEGGIYVNYKTPFNNQPQGIDRFAPKVRRVFSGGLTALHPSVIQRWNDSTMNYKPINLKDLSELLDTHSKDNLEALKESA
jgi:hypothetical protein